MYHSLQGVARLHKVWQDVDVRFGKIAARCGKILLQGLTRFPQGVARLHKVSHVGHVNYVNNEARLWDMST